MRLRVGTEWPLIHAALGLLAGFSILMPAAIPAAEPKEVDAAVRRELDAIEGRFGEAIEKRDTAALSELLAEYYADSVGDAEKAVAKSGVIARAKAGRLFFYRIEKGVRLRVSGETYDFEGDAKAPPRGISDLPAEPKWVHVRRVWVKQNGKWLLILQNVREAEAEKSVREKK
jgi:hypothetical protein